MRLAVPFDPETGLVANHFGHTPHFNLYTEDMSVVFTDVVDSPANGHDGVCAFLAENGVQVVLCQHLGDAARDALFDAGIAVIAGVAGPADDLVIALLENRLRVMGDGACHQHGEGCACGCGCGEDGCDDESCSCGCGC